MGGDSEEIEMENYDLGLWLGRQRVYGDTWGNVNRVFGNKRIQNVFSLCVMYSEDLTFVIICLRKT